MNTEKMKLIDFLTDQKIPYIKIKLTFQKVLNKKTQKIENQKKPHYIPSYNKKTDKFLIQSKEHQKIKKLNGWTGIIKLV